ncbi:MAG: T7 exonuclease [Chloroflexi bacterium]|nr:T7 exonuclease [Chloroflexota bacterium]
MLLIDSDFLAYKAAQACEIGIDFGEDVIIAQSQFSEVLKVFHNELNKVTKAMMEDNFILYFSSTKNFRKKIYPDYKGHRMKRKPLGYKRLVNYCRENHNFKLIEGLEADDTIGIEATRFADPSNIIVSPDKDMRQIPSTLWNLTDDVTEITKDDGDRWHLIQSLSGDPTDGYSGCPGIGVKRATELLNKNENKWEAVCKAYRDRGLSDDDALLNARLAKILRNEDYDHDRNQPILWTPN